MQINPATLETRDLLVCRSCQAEARQQDRFCRRCGVAHESGERQVSARVEQSEFSREGLNRGATNQLVAGEAYHSVSGSLVRAVITSVSNSAAIYQGSRYLNCVVPVLLLLPLWLMILLLSPLDAYVSAKAMSKGI